MDATFSGTLWFDAERWAEAKAQNEDAALGATVDEAGRTLRFEDAEIGDPHWDLAQAAVAGALHVRRGEYRWVLCAGWGGSHQRPRHEGERVGASGFPLPQRSAHAIAVSPSGEKLAVVCTAGHSVQVVLLDVATAAVEHVWTARETEEMRHAPTFGVADYAARAAFSPDGRRVYAAGMDRHLWTWDVESGALLARHRLERTPAALAFGPGRLALVYRDRSAIHLLDPDDPERDLGHGLVGVGSRVRSLELRGAALFASSDYETQRIDLESGEERRWSLGLEAVRASDTHLAGIVWNDGDPKVVVLALDEDEPVWEFAAHARKLAFLGSSLFVFTQGGVLRADIEARVVTSLLELTATQELDGDVQPFGERLLVGFGARVVELDPHRPELPAVAPGPERWLSPDGERAVLHAIDRAAPDVRLQALIDTATLERVATFAEGQVGWSPDGSVLASLRDGKVRYLDARDGTELGGISLAGAEYASKPVLGSEGDLAVRVDDDVVVYDGATGLARWRQAAEDFCLAPSGRRIGVRLGDTWTIYDLETEREIARVETAGALALLADESGWIVADETLRCCSDRGMVRWERPIAWAGLAVAVDPRFVAVAAGHYLLLDASSGETLASTCPHPFHDTVALGAGGTLIALAETGSVARTPPQAEPLALERLAGPLRERLAVGAAEREAVDRAPLEFVAERAEVSGHEPLPAAVVDEAPEGLLARFARPQRIHDDEGDPDDEEAGEVLHRAPDRVWRGRDGEVDGSDSEDPEGYGDEDEYGEEDAGDRMTLIVTDASGEELGRGVVHSAIELSFSPDGRWAIGRLPSFAVQMYSAVTFDEEPEDRDAQLDEAAVSLFVFDDRAEERAAIVPATSGPYLRVGDLAWAGDRLVVEVSTDEEQNLEIWDLETSELRCTIPRVGAFCAVGERVAVLDEEGRALRIHDAESGEQLAQHVFDEVRDEVLGAGEDVATTGGGELTLHRVTDGALLRELSVPARSGALSADGLFWEEDADPEKRRWRLEDGRPLHDHAGDVRAIAADQGWIATLDGFGEVIVRRIDGEVRMREALRHDAQIALVGGHIALLDAGALRVVDLESGAQRVSALRVSCVACAEGRLLTGDEGGMLRVWELERGEQARAIPLGLSPAGMAVSGDGKVLLAWGKADGSGDGSGELALLDLETGDRIGVLPIEVSSYGAAVAVAARGDRVVHVEGTATLYDARGEELASLPVQDAGCAAFTPDGEALIVGTYDATYVFGAARGDPRGRIDTLRSARQLTFDSEGRLICGLSAYGIEVWDGAALGARGWIHSAELAGRDEGGRSI